MRITPHSRSSVSVSVVMILACFGFWGFRPPTGVQLDLSLKPALHDSSQSRINSLFAQANDFAQKYFDNRRALALYSKALEIEAENSDLLWHVSRAYVDIGEHLPTLTDEEKLLQLETYEKALDFGRKAVSADPGSSMALTRRAIAMNRVGLFKGFWESIGLLKESKADLQRALQLDSTNHLAYYALGRTHLRALERPWVFRWPLGLSWGSMREALKYFQTAITLKSDFIAYRLAYARALIDDGKEEQARAQLSVIPLLPIQDEDDMKYRSEAKDLLEAIKEEE